MSACIVYSENHNYHSTTTAPATVHGSNTRSQEREEEEMEGKAIASINFSTFDISYICMLYIFICIFIYIISYIIYSYLRKENGKAIANITFPTSDDRNDHGSEDSAPNPSFLSPFCFSELENVKSFIAKSIQVKS